MSPEPFLRFLNPSRARYRNFAMAGFAASLFLVAVGIVYTAYQEDVVLRQNERAMQRLTDGVIQGLTSVMLAGSADIAQSYADRLKRMPEVSDINILRTSGEEAFRDNATIDAVNRRRGEILFSPREMTERIAVVSPDDPNFRRVLTERKPMPVYETAPNGVRTLNFYAPIENQAACHKCHSEAFPVRGVIRLSTSLAAIDRDILRIRQQSLIVIALALMVVMLSTGYLIGREVLDERDEALRDAGGLQAMAAIIHDADEGVVVADHEGRIVLANPAAERLIGKAADQIAANGFERLFEDSQAEATLRARGSHAEFAIDHLGRHLRVVVSSVRAGGLTRGSAALLRDLSHERRLEEELEKSSTIDFRTGLKNRRHLDEALKTEFLRALRTHSLLSLVAVDIDGHEAILATGADAWERAVVSVAQALRRAMRKYDVPACLEGSRLLAILPDTDCEGALAVAERLRADLASARLDGKELTISLGVATYPDVAVDSPEGMLEEALGALRTAMGAGGNRVGLAGGWAGDDASPSRDA